MGGERRSTGGSRDGARPGQKAGALADCFRLRFRICSARDGLKHAWGLGGRWRGEEEEEETAAAQRTLAGCFATRQRHLRASCPGQSPPGRSLVQSSHFPPTTAAHRIELANLKRAPGARNRTRGRLRLQDQWFDVLMVRPLSRSLETRARQQAR